MEKGQIVTLRIEDMSAEGQGIGRVAEPGGERVSEPGGDEKLSREGMVVFVADTVPGDLVQAQISKVKKHFAFGRVTEMLERSTHRNDAFDCPYFREGCGGCPMAMLDYEAQLDLKQRQVRQRLVRLAHLEDPLVRPILGMEDGDNGDQGCFRYRDKASFPVSTGGIITRKGGIVENLGDPAVGFYQARSHEVVDCEDCYLQSMAAMAAADALRRFMEEDHITAFDPKWEKGLLRQLIVKTAFGTGEVMVILVINGKGIPGVQKLVEMLDDAIYEVGYSLESVVLNINRASGKNVERNKKKDRSQIRLSGPALGEEYVTIAGKNTIQETVGHLQFEISPASFFQVNPVQMKRLYDQVREYVMLPIDGSTPSCRPVLLDLYCGVGSIGLYCADLAEMVVGIESVKEAVTDANRNAVINGIVNARYLCGKAEDVLPTYVDGGSDPQLADYIHRADIAILDPPRAGCRPQLLESVAQAGVQRIIYVSCDPATLARDVQLLGEMGYAFQEATPVDMFPHTGHVETVAQLTREQK